MNNFESVPDDLKSRPSWVAWRMESRDGKNTKVPYQAQNGQRASSTDPSTWTTFTTAREAYSRKASGYTGIGYVLHSDDPFVGVDIDHCIDADGNLSPEAAGIVALLGSYTEITPSGHGLRVFIKGTLPGKRTKKGNVEMYQAARFLTVTGNVFCGGAIIPRQEEIESLYRQIFGEDADDAPTETRRARPISDLALSDQTVMARASAAKNGGKFDALWRGDYQAAGFTSHSEADSALCYHLAFWTGANSARVDSLFRDSGLMREKWDVKHFGDGRTYGQGTIDKACANVSETYQPKNLTNLNSAPTPAVDVVNDVNDVNALGNGNSPSIYNNKLKNGLLGTVDNVYNVYSAYSEPETGDWDDIVPLGAHNLPAFPVEALPGWLESFVTAVAEQTQTPPDLAAMLSLSACSASVAKKFAISPKTGWTESLNLYTATVLSAGNRKSAVNSCVTKPLEEFERLERERLAPSVAMAQSEKRIAEAKIKDLEREAAKAKGTDYHAAMDNLREATTQYGVMEDKGDYRLFTEDCTPERLAGLLAENDGRMAIMSAEGDTFDIISGRYSEKTNLGVYLKSHNGETLLVDRIGRKAERVDTPSLTIGMAIQPDVIRGLLVKSQLRGRGLLGRFLFSLPQDHLGWRDTDPSPIPADVLSTYADAMFHLLSQPTDYDKERIIPRIITLSDGAREMFRAYEKSTEEKLRQGNDLGDMTDWGGKLCGAVARIAGVLHLAGHASPARDITYEILPGDMVGAIQIGMYLTRHAMATFSEMGADADLDNARLILGWIQRHGQATFTQRRLYQGLARRFKKSEDMAPGLELLSTRNYLRQNLPTADEKKHNKGSDFIVNPLAFDVEIYH